MCKWSIPFFSSYWASNLNLPLVSARKNRSLKMSPTNNGFSNGWPSLSRTTNRTGEYVPLWMSFFRFILKKNPKRFVKSVNWPKPGYASITCSTISNIPYSLIFSTKCNDSSNLITIISCDYLNLSLADEQVGDVTIPTQVVQYNQNFLQAN